MKTKYKYVLLFIFLFIVFLVWELFAVELYADEVWNYGFAYSISRGLVPYLDYNMIVPPLWFYLIVLEGWDYFYQINMYRLHN